MMVKHFLEHGPAPVPTPFPPLSYQVYAVHSEANIANRTQKLQSSNHRDPAGNVPGLCSSAWPLTASGREGQLPAKAVQTHRTGWKGTGSPHCPWRTRIPCETTHQASLTDSPISNARRGHGGSECCLWNPSAFLPLVNTQTTRQLMGEQCLYPGHSRGRG